MTRGSADVSEGSITSATERVAQALREEILTGARAPGERIRQEEVAERLGGSRLPVREALRILAAEGLVEIEPHKGARVPRLDRDEVEVLYRMRERLEPLALLQSIPVLDQGDLDGIEGIQERIEAGVSVSEFLALDREFHMTTYVGCGTDHLMTTIDRLWNATQHYRRAFMSLAGPGRQWVVNAEHRLLLDALRRQDGEDAERYLAGHIRRTRKELITHPEIFS